MTQQVQPREILNQDGNRSGKYRLTAKSDEDGGGPQGNPNCYHDSAKECENCFECDKYISKVTGFPPTLENDEFTE